MSLKEEDSVLHQLTNNIFSIKYDIKDIINKAAFDSIPNNAEIQSELINAEIVENELIETLSSQSSISNGSIISSVPSHKSVKSVKSIKSIKSEKSKTSTTSEKTSEKTSESVKFPEIPNASVLLDNKLLYSKCASFILLGTKLFEEYVNKKVTQNYKYINISGYTNELQNNKTELIDVLSDIDPLKNFSNTFNSPYIKLLLVFVSPLFVITINNYLIYINSTSKNVPSDNHNNESPKMSTNSMNKTYSIKSDTSINKTYSVKSAKKIKNKFVYKNRRDF